MKNKTVQLSFCQKRNTSVFFHRPLTLHLIRKNMIYFHRETIEQQSNQQIELGQCMFRGERKLRICCMWICQSNLVPCSCQKIYPMKLMVDLEEEKRINGDGKETNQIFLFFFFFFNNFTGYRLTDPTSFSLQRADQVIGKYWFSLRDKREVVLLFDQVAIEDIYSSAQFLVSLVSTLIELQTSSLRNFLESNRQRTQTFWFVFRLN